MPIVPKLLQKRDFRRELHLSPAFSSCPKVAYPEQQTLPTTLMKKQGKQQMVEGRYGTVKGAAPPIDSGVSGQSVRENPRRDRIVRLAIKNRYVIYI
jgi:hypothetical protein